jgi:DNA polymerase
MSDEAALEELRFLTRALRAHVQWQAATGATGLERASEATRTAALAEPRAPEQVAEAVPEPSEALDRARERPPEPARERLPEPARERLPEPERQRQLQVLAEAVRPCTRCRLSEHRKQTVFARGNGSSGVCFVGEGPGADEDAQGFPFVGKAGQLLDRMIEAMGLARDDVYVCNVVKCRPPDNRKPEPDEMAACMPYLNEQLDLVAPQVIVALGATAVQGLFGTTEGITRMRGKWKTLRDQIPVMPTFHPAYLLRNPAAKREVWEDLQAVLRRIGKSPPTRR